MALLNVAVAAKVAGVSKSLVYELCRTGRLIHYRIGQRGKRGKVLVDANDLRAFLRECRMTEGPTPDPPLKHIR